MHVPKSELDVKATSAELASGEADAVVVNVTDVKAAGDKVHGVEILANQNVIASHPVAALKGSKHLAAAEAFVNEIASGGVHQVLAARGFLPPA